MRQIINGRMYDTDRAQLIGGVFYDTLIFFTREYTDLYKTADGVYFFYKQRAKRENSEQFVFIDCEGPGCRDGLGRIELIQESEARRWAEENLTIAEYLKGFTLNTDIPIFDGRDDNTYK